MEAGMAWTTTETLSFDTILASLQQLDRRLEHALIAAESAYGPAAAGDPYRGLHISDQEIDQLISREPGALILQSPDDLYENSLTDATTVENPFARLQARFDLTPFDLDILLIALAPEIDLRYERLYAYLQDDVTRKRPSVDLALGLLCTSPTDKLARRRHFAANAPLVQHQLIHLFHDANPLHAPLLGQALRVDEQIVRFLLDEPSLDSRLSQICEVIEPVMELDALILPEGFKQTFVTLAHQVQTSDEPLRLYIHGQGGLIGRQTAEAIAHQIHVALLDVDCSRLRDTTLDMRVVASLLFRTAEFYPAILYLSGLDALSNTEHAPRLQALIECLASSRGITVLSGAQPWRLTSPSGLDVISVSPPTADFAQRQIIWQNQLQAAGNPYLQDDIDVLADRFRLTPDEIAAVVNTARQRARWRSATGSSAACELTREDLFYAARQQSGHELAELTRKIEPFYTWDDIVLPEDARQQLRELCQRVDYRQAVFDTWGFHRKLAYGRGINALFAGPSGTGKTMAAAIIGNHLGLDLYQIDLAGVVSKYIGETEKNLDRIFTAAENANAILFFDEADALFGKRSEVRDSHDRYANLEISYLLQKMEAYDGIAILATNLHQNLDEAFMRRLSFVVNFPFPDEDQRRRIWQAIWPPETRLAPDVDLDALARQFQLSGGNIKNIALSAAFFAAAEGGAVAQSHLLMGTRREYQKLGKVAAEFS